jgi:hypothetical protein
MQAVVTLLLRPEEEVGIEMRGECPLKYFENLLKILKKISQRPLNFHKFQEDFLKVQKLSILPLELLI